MIYKPDDEIFDREKRRRRILRILFIAGCIVLFALGFIFVGPIISAFA